MSDKDRICPRDRALLRETPVGDAKIDICGTCHGMFFDSGELFGAAGIDADPSTWDRPETGGVVKAGALPCPRCAHVVMEAQDVTLEQKHVEIDRCGKCRGIWLDKDELDVVVAIGHALRPALDAARAKAKAEVDKLGDVDFRPPSSKKPWIIAGAIAAVIAIGFGVYAYVQANSPEAKRAAERRRSQEVEGCPCGCDRSARMAAELRNQGGGDASKAIESSLVTIAEREHAGYITERMILHRIRLLDLASEMGVGASRPETRRLMSPTPEPRSAPAERCTVSAEDRSLRVCADLAVHGERSELVDGQPKLITSCFRLWLEIENLGDESRTLSPVVIDGGAVHFPIERWYRQDSRGDAWDGVVRAHEKIRINAIGYTPEHVVPGTAIRTEVTLASLVMHTATEARAVIHLVD